MAWPPPNQGLKFSTDTDRPKKKTPSTKFGTGQKPTTNDGRVFCSMIADVADPSSSSIQTKLKAPMQATPADALPKLPGQQARVSPSRSGPGHLCSPVRNRRLQSSSVSFRAGRIDPSHCTLEPAVVPVTGPIFPAVDFPWD